MTAYLQRFLGIALAALVLVTAGTAPCQAAVPPSFSIALYYAAKPPLDELQAFDVVVVDPDTVGTAPNRYNSPHSELFAYVSVGEADPQRSFFKKIDPAWLIADNLAWKSKVVDLANPAWRAFFLNQVLEPLWTAGYRGFFLDTLDSYQLVADKNRQRQLEAGLVTLLRSIKQRHPEARLIFNRGFEVLEQVKDTAFAVAAESLFRNFDPTSGRYGEVKEADRSWLLDRFAEVRKAGLPVIAIEYVAPGERELARATARKVADLGYIPWVTDKDLASLGLGSVEVLPRTILGLYDGSEAPDPVYTDLQRLAAMPLNYLGYKLELHDLRTPLPTMPLAGRYAGVVIWPYADDSGKRQDLLGWIVRHVLPSGVKLVFLDRFGIPPERVAAALKLSYHPPRQMPNKLEIVQRAALMGFELPLVAKAEPFVPLRVIDGQPLLSIGNSGTALSDPVALTPWGGYALAPYLTASSLADTTRWVLDPFEFLSRALTTVLQPVPDVTTENGRRLLLTHIDGDGFESRVERYNGPLAATELRETVLKKYRIPTTFSVITSSLGDQGHNLQQAAQLQEEARQIYRLPWVEAGSHTFSHPFYWQNTEVAKRNYKMQYLPIAGYRFDLQQEIAGSSRFINTNLLPPGKQVKLLQWSGDCTPGTDALAVAQGAGLCNINGGSTVITRSNNSLTLVAPLGVDRNGYFQVFAPNQNENVYTNDWTGPFYGFRRVIETFQLTDTPRRLKPINIYYHVYSVTKEAAHRALDEVYAWALAQAINPIFTSAYVDKVLDFNRTVVARQADGWLIRNRGELRELRLPRTAGYPDLRRSRNLIGYSDHGDSRYLHLGPGGEALVVLSAQPPGLPYLQSVGGTLTAFERFSHGMRVRVAVPRATTISFGASNGCRLYTANGREVRYRYKDELLTADLAEGEHGLELRCP